MCGIYSGTGSGALVGLWVVTSSQCMVRRDNYRCNSRFITFQVIMFCYNTFVLVCLTLSGFKKKTLSLQLKHTNSHQKYLEVLFTRSSMKWIKRNNFYHTSFPNHSPQHTFGSFQNIDDTLKKYQDILLNANLSKMFRTLKTYGQVQL